MALSVLNLRIIKSELELDFTEGYQSSNVSSNQNLVSTNTVNDESLQQVQRSASEETSKEISSPMVGTFFLQDSKELTDPQIKVGDKVKSGDIIGYVEE